MRKKIFLPLLSVDRVRDDEKVVSLQVEVTPAARRVVDGLKETFGVTKRVGVERLVEWFASQDKRVQRAILDRSADAATEIAREKMAAMTEAGDSTALSNISIPKAVELIRLLTQRIEQIDEARRRELADRVPKKKS